MDDAEHEHDPVFIDHVVHHQAIADPQSMERVPGSVDRLDGPARKPLNFVQKGRAAGDVASPRGSRRNDREPKDGCGIR